MGAHRFFIIMRIILQIILLFLMLICIFCFSTSFAYGSINRYQIIYSLLLILMSILGIKLAANNKFHQHISYYTVMLTALMWLWVVVHDMIF